MIQDLLTSLIVASSAGYSLYCLYGMIIPSKKNSAAHCSGCAACAFKTSSSIPVSRIGSSPAASSVMPHHRRQIHNS